MTTDDDRFDDHRFDRRPIGRPGPGHDRSGPSTTDPLKGARVLRAGATVDAAAAAEMRREARALLARSSDPLVVDLTAVRAAEPAASGLLRELAYEAGEADVDLRIVRDPGAPEVTRALLGDETLFEIYPSLGAALDGAVDAPGDLPGHPPAPGAR